MTGRRRWMIGLSALLVVGQLTDTVWPRADDRAATPATVFVATMLLFLLALYPDGRFVPRWTLPVAALGSAVFAGAAVIGPDASARFLWPLPLAPFVLLLLLGGQGYRYLRRASAAERESVRWPLLGLLVLVTLVIAADSVAVLLTGTTLPGSPVLGAIMQVALLLPGIGFLAGLLAPRTELVDRLLALWIAVVVAAALLAAVFAGATSLAGLWLAAPAPAWIGAAAVAAGSVAALPLARRAGRRLVFRGRADPRAAVGRLHERLGSTLDLADVPAEITQAIVDATGSRQVVLRRWGQAGVWATAGTAEAPAPAPVPGDDVWTTVVTHLGLPLATLEVASRPGESALASEDRRIVGAVASAAAPALHGARLASAFPELTDRERQVLAGIVRGLPNSAIAQRLGVSSKTVANYVSIVLTKLRVPDKERAAELARRRSAEYG